MLKLKFCLIASEAADKVLIFPKPVICFLFSLCACCRTTRMTYLCLTKRVLEIILALLSQLSFFFFHFSVIRAFGRILGITIMSLFEVILDAFGQTCHFQEIEQKLISASANHRDASCYQTVVVDKITAHTDSFYSKWFRFTRCFCFLERAF